MTTSVNTHTIQPQSIELFEPTYAGKRRNVGMTQRPKFTLDDEIPELQQLGQTPPSFLGPIGIGLAHPVRQDVVFGAPCIRRDLESLSLKSLYQMLVPMFVAAYYRLPCVLSLGVGEE